MHCDYNWALRYVCSHHSSAQCNDTYPRTGHNTQSWFALSSQLWPLHLSCYTAQANLTPWLDNSPFFSSTFQPCLDLNKKLVSPLWEELNSLSSSHRYLEAIKSIPEMSISCRKLLKLFPQCHFPFLHFTRETGIPRQAALNCPRPQRPILFQPRANNSSTYFISLRFCSLSPPPLPQNWLLCWRAFRELAVTT